MPIKQVLLTRKEYRDITGDTRQNVQNKIKRGTLKTTMVPAKKEEERIVLTLTQWDAIQLKRQLRLVDGVHGEE